MNHYPHHIGDYAEATAHLSFVEDAAYSRLIRKYYAIEKPLPADVKAVQRLVGARTKEERDAVQTVLSEFFTLQDDGWHQPRCDAELERYFEKSSKASASANSRWKASGRNANASHDDMRPHESGNANASETHAERNANQEPRTKNQEETKTRQPASRSAVMPPGFDLKIWQDFTAIRKAKRSPLTETALAGIEREAVKAGLTLESALRMCCERGWQGFEASWLKQSRGSAGGKSSDIEARNRESVKEAMRLAGGAGNA